MCFSDSKNVDRMYCYSIIDARSLVSYRSAIYCTKRDWFRIKGDVTAKQQYGYKAMTLSHTREMMCIQDIAMESLGAW